MYLPAASHAPGSGAVPLDEETAFDAYCLVCEKLITLPKRVEVTKVVSHPVGQLVRSTSTQTAMHDQPTGKASTAIDQMKNEPINQAVDKAVDSSINKLVKKPAGCITVSPICTYMPLPTDSK